MRTEIYWFVTPLAFLSQCIAPQDLYALPSVTLTEDTAENGESGNVPASFETSSTTTTTTVTTTSSTTSTTLQTSSCFGSITVRSINGCSSTDYCADSQTGTRAEYAQRHNAGSDDVITGPGAARACLDKIKDDCGNDGKVHFAARTDGSPDYLAETDDCVMSKLFTSEDYNNTPASQWQKIATAAGVESLGTYTSYMDGSCNVLKDPPVNQICDSLDVMISPLASPVSLLWNKKAQNASVTVTHFPLDPEQQGKWFSWEASENTPLLVYDPSRNGQITVAAQLFGNFTFGKRWRNGYEALGSLDRNHDGRLSGDELNALGLWFDKNQNGVSEPGEVQPAVDAGVSAVYFDPNSADKASGRISASHGYEVVVDGRKVEGGSVDWFAHGYNSESEAIESLKDAAQELGRGKTSGLKKLPKNSSAATANAMSGLWIWSSGPDREKFGPKGMLSFVAKGGTVSGHSLIEVPMKRNPFGIGSYIVANPISQGSTALKNGVTTVSFLVTGKNGSTTQSEATLSSDGSRLTGVSKTLLSSNGQSESRTLTYKWRAERQLFRRR